MKLSWKRAIGRPAPVTGKTWRLFKLLIARLRPSYDSGLQHNHEAWGMWVNHVIPPRSCITLEDNTSSQSLLKLKKSSVLRNSNPETNHRRKHWLEMMLSSIKDHKRSVRISIWNFRSHSAFPHLFFSAYRLDSDQFVFRLRAQFLCSVHAQAWYQPSRYQATADPCVTSRGPGVFHLLGLSRFTDTGALFGFPGR